MSLWNALLICQMAVDPTCLKMLAEVNRCFAKDPDFSWRRGIECSLRAIHGEKILKVDGGYLVSSFLPPIPSRAFRTMLTATPEDKCRFKQLAALKRTAPISFYIALTERCTYDCAHCSAKGRSSGEELSTDEWKRVLAELQDMGTSIIGFTGGEPFLREDLEEIVSSVDDRSITYIFTNGADVSQYRTRALKDAGLFGIGVSLDSADPGEHDQIRGRVGAFSSALAAMEDAKAAGLHVMAQTVLAKDMLRLERRDDLVRLFKLAKAHGAAEIRLLEPICSGALLSRGDSSIFYSPDDRKALISIQEQVNRRWDCPKVTAFAHTESAERYGCGAGNQHSYIGADGQLFPYDFVPLSFGNVREGGVQDLWLEMTGVVGKPKPECFAARIRARLCERGESGIPVPRDESGEICRADVSEDYPGFFKALQK